jgi:hypothetical protein
MEKVLYKFVILFKLDRITILDISVAIGIILIGMKLIIDIVNPTKLWKDNYTTK